MKNPCISCTNEHFRCRHTCPIGVRYQIARAKERAIIRAEQQKEIAYTTYKMARVLETKKKAGVE